MEHESELLKGKVAVVSGVGPGLGRRAAVRLAANGADVALGARRQSSLDDVASEIEALGRRVVTLSTDITYTDQCDALCALAAKELGRVDVLVNNAFRFDAFQEFEDVDHCPMGKNYRDKCFWFVANDEGSVAVFDSGRRWLGDYGGVARCAKAPTTTRWVCHFERRFAHSNQSLGV